MPSQKFLVVTADDFGLAPEVNGAVEQAHRDGILTAASLMVGSPGCADALERARRLPGLRVGLHLVLVEARPVLPPDKIPDLVDTAGHFRTDMARLGAAMFFLPHVRRQLFAEVEAQFAAYAATGLPFDHVNAHKHFHLHPTIASAVIATARRYGVRAVRVPAEPAALVRSIEPDAPRFVPALTAPFTRRLGTRLRRAGFRVPDQVFGLAWSGAMTEARIAAVIERLPPGVTELYTHPATSGDFTGAAPGYRYGDELAALIATSVRATTDRIGVPRGGFSDLG